MAHSRVVLAKDSAAARADVSFRYCPTNFASFQLVPFVIAGHDGRIRPMCQTLRFLGSLDWVAISALFVAVLSFVIARKALQDAEASWKQEKWFDLYAKADEGYNTLDRYCTIYKASPQPQTAQQANDWNSLMFLIRQVHATAMVFPAHPAIDKLVKATTSFDNPASASERLPLFLEAVMDLRDMATLDPSVLTIRKRSRSPRP
jgi:hypothetical protein